jgi:hypothetical protein
VCWFCSLPEELRDYVETERRNNPRISWPTWAAFLREKHGLKDATVGKLARHFREHSHVRASAKT